MIFSLSLPLAHCRICTQNKNLTVIRTPFSLQFFRRGCCPEEYRRSWPQSVVSGTFSAFSRIEFIEYGISIGCQLPSSL